MSTVRSLPKRIPVLARLLGARRAVEVGTFTGYSAIAIACGLAADGGLLCCEANAEWAYQQAETQTTGPVASRGARENLAASRLAPR